MLQYNSFSSIGDFSYSIVHLFVRSCALLMEIICNARVYWCDWPNAQRVANVRQERNKKRKTNDGEEKEVKNKKLKFESSEQCRAIKEENDDDDDDD